MTIDFSDEFSPGAPASIPNQPKQQAANLKLALFEIGQLVATPNALEHLSQTEIIRAIRRHIAGDWGDLNEHDQIVNNRALEEGGRLLSCYHSEQKVKFYVITEEDRSCTTVLLPEDY